MKKGLYVIGHIVIVICIVGLAVSLTVKSMVQDSVYQIIEGNLLNKVEKMADVISFGQGEEIAEYLKTTITEKEDVQTFVNEYMDAVVVAVSEDSELLLPAITNEIIDTLVDSAVDGVVGQISESNPFYQSIQEYIDENIATLKGELHTQLEEQMRSIVDTMEIDQRVTIRLYSMLQATGLRIILTGLGLVSLLLVFVLQKEKIKNILHLSICFIISGTIGLLYTVIAPKILGTTFIFDLTVYLMLVPIVIGTIGIGFYYFFNNKHI